jgi:hypothetical protein
MGLLMSWRAERGKGEVFPARIGRKSGLAMGLALLLVLLVGGISIVLSLAISGGTKLIKSESDEIEYVNQLHTLMHHAVEAVQNVVCQEKQISLKTRVYAREPAWGCGRISRRADRAKGYPTED